MTADESALLRQIAQRQDELIDLITRLAASLSWATQIAEPYKATLPRGASE